MKSTLQALVVIQKVSIGNYLNAIIFKNHSLSPT